MKDHTSKRFLSLAGSTAAGAFLILLVSPSPAQKGNPTGGTPSNPAIDRMRETKERETELRSLEMKSREPANKSEVNEIFLQIKQDFERIQTIRNELIDALSTGKALGDKHILEATAEIKKRASRLKTQLVLHKPEDDEKGQKGQIELSTGKIEDALTILCNRIFSFTTNPIFKSPGIVDIKESARASRDLQTIIDLSHDIRKSVERQGKANK